MNTFKQFVDYYKTFTKEQHLRRSVFNRTAFLDSLKLFGIMTVILLLIAFISKLQTNITYLFISLNMSFLCSFLLYNYRVMLEDEHYTNKVYTLIYKTMYVVYYQLIMFALSIVTIFRMENNDFNLIISLILIIILTGIFMYVGVTKIKKWHRKYNIIFVALGQSILSFLVFSLSLHFLGIHNVTVGFITSYLMMYILTILSDVVVVKKEFLKARETLQFLGLACTVVISLMTFVIFLDKDNENNETFYQFVLSERHTGELYSPIINTTDTYSIEYPEQISDYSLIKADRYLFEDDDYIYLIMTSTYSWSSISYTDENGEKYYREDVTEPFTFLAVYNKDFELEAEYYFDVTSLFVLDEERVMLFMSTGDVYSDDTVYKVYEVDGPNLIRSSVFDMSTFPSGTYFKGFMFFEQDNRLFRSLLYAHPGYNLIEYYLTAESEDDRAIFEGGPINMGPNMGLLYSNGYSARFLKQQQMTSLGNYGFFHHNGMVVANNLKLYTLENYEISYFENVDGEFTQLDIKNEANWSGIEGMFVSEDSIYLNTHNQLYQFDYEGNEISFTEVFVPHFDMERYQIIAMDDRVVIYFIEDGLIKTIDIDNIATFQFRNDDSNVLFFEIGLLVLLVTVSKKENLLKV